MKESIKIMHIDGDYRIAYILISGGALSKSTVALEDAITMLKNIKFDLILFEPQQMAILTPCPPIKKKNNLR